MHICPFLAIEGPSSRIDGRRALLGWGTWGLCWALVTAVAAQDAPPAPAPESAPAAPQADDDLPPRPAVPPPAVSSAAPSESGDARRTPPRVSSRELFARNGSTMRAAFKQVVGKASRATVHVHSGSRQIALGVIVDPSGFVVTKWSELNGQIQCKLHDERMVPATVFGIDKVTDLALLKIDAGDLPTVAWNEEALEVGSWLVTADRTAEPLGIGVVGVAVRLIRPSSGFMGVNLEEHDPGILVSSVSPETPAEKAGIRPNDVIIKINDQTVNDRQELVETVMGYRPGDTIQVTLLRDGRELQVDVTLADRQESDPNSRRSNFQNSMGSTLSRRRTDFPLALQHDTALGAAQCGGPVCDLSGRVVGINIARAGRVATLALPASVVLPLVDKLKTGQFAPALVHKDRIDEINRLLNELNLVLASMPAESDSLDAELEKLAAAEAEAKKQLDAAMEKLQEAARDKMRVELQRDEKRQKIEQAEREKQRLEREREKLVTGS
jgi:serine protease Do